MAAIFEQCGSCNDSDDHDAIIILVVLFCMCRCIKKNKTR